MRLSDLPLHPTHRVLRQFAGLWLILCGLLAAWQAWQGNSAAALAMGLVALAVGAPGLVRPALVRPLFVGWTIAVFPIGWLVSRLSLALLYYGMITPLALVFRLRGRDELRLRRPAPGETCWRPLEKDRDPVRYFRQY